jgi:arabinogalactan oligomer / maltooligosaccharide transport system permease protein
MFNLVQNVMSNEMLRAKWGGYFLRMIVVIFALVFAFFPVIWIISASVNEVGTLNTQVLIPQKLGLGNYDELLNNDIHPFDTWMFNSIKISTIASILSVLITAMGAYAFSRFRFKGRRTLMLVVFLVQVFPSTLTIVATFLLIQSIGNRAPSFGLNTQGGAILVYLGGALGINTWLMKGFFDSIPRDLDESAKIDGASDWLIFVRIILPLVRPVLAVVGILTFIFTYADVIIALTLLKSPGQQTLAVGLNGFISESYDTEWGPFAAGAIIGAIPLVVLILTFQRFFTSGLTEGAVKG